MVCIDSFFACGFSYPSTPPANAHKCTYMSKSNDTYTHILSLFFSFSFSVFSFKPSTSSNWIGCIYPRHRWIHCMTDELPTPESIKKQPWQIEHYPNLTETNVSLRMEVPMVRSIRFTQFCLLFLTHSLLRYLFSSVPMFHTPLWPRRSRHGTPRQSSRIVHTYRAPLYMFVSPSFYFLPPSPANPSRPIRNLTIYIDCIAKCRIKKKKNRSKEA